MEFTITFNNAEIKTVFDWQLVQEVNVYDANKLIAKAELEILTLNKNRNAVKTYQMLDQQGATDWEIPLNVLFKNQNLITPLCEQLAITPETKKSAQHLMIETISVLPDYRNKGIAKQLLTTIANEYAKAQSIIVLAMPLSLFVDAQACDTPEDCDYYQAIVSEDKNNSVNNITAFFEKHQFITQHIDSKLLAEPLPYQLLLSTPNRLI